MSLFDLVSDEIEQREQTGYEVGFAVAALAKTDPADGPRLEQIYAELIAAPRSAAWDYEEPEDLAGEIKGIAGELYEALSRQWSLIGLLDACAWDLPDLASAAPTNIHVTAPGARRGDFMLRSPAAASPSCWPALSDGTTVGV